MFCQLREATADTDSMNSTRHRKSVQPTFWRNPEKPRQYGPIKRGVVCEDERIFPVVVIENRLYFIVSPAEPFGLLAILFYPHANNFKSIIPYVLLSC